MVRRDRNHPSVDPLEHRQRNPRAERPEGRRSPRAHRDIVHDEDPTRPVTAGCNNADAGYNGFQKAVDVFGYNYNPGDYAQVPRTNPATSPLLGQRDVVLRQLARRILLPGQRRQGEGRGRLPGQLLRRRRAALGLRRPTTSFAATTQIPSVARRVRLDRLRLPRRADALQQRRHQPAQLLRPGRSARR